MVGNSVKEKNFYDIPNDEKIIQMKIAFCCAEDINLGAGYVIAYLKKQGHEVKLFFDPLQFNRGYARNSLLAKTLNIENYNLSWFHDPLLTPIKDCPYQLHWSCISRPWRFYEPPVGCYLPGCGWH